MARIALRPYAKLPQNSRTTTIATKANDLGGSEALGAMLRLARIEVTDDRTSHPKHTHDLKLKVLT